MVISVVFVYVAMRNRSVTSATSTLQSSVALGIVIICSTILGIKLSKVPSALHYVADKNMLMRYIDVISQATAQHNAYINEYKQLSYSIEHNASNTIIEKSTATIPNIIFIIGESTQRNYMSLYGYKLDTTPNLQALAARGNLVVFYDVISPHSHTNESLQKVLTLSNYENASTPWYMQANLLDLLNAAGYETYWLSNQEAVSVYGNAPESISRRAKYTRFSAWNDSSTSGRLYDEVLLRMLDEVKQKPADNNFYVIHLMGTHLNYKDRYPLSFAKFNTDSLTQNNLDTYLNQPLQLSPAQLQTKVHYLNAVAYNDYIVNAIIERFAHSDALVFYLSDHGDEVFDFRDFMGHAESMNSRFMVEIPFMIYMSDTFKRKHKQLAEQITQARHLPFMTDDFIHTLLNLLFIEAKVIEEERALFHPNYNIKRTRISGGRDYDRDLKTLK